MAFRLTAATPTVALHTSASASTVVLALSLAILLLTTGCNDNRQKAANNSQDSEQTNQVPSDDAEENPESSENDPTDEPTEQPDNEQENESPTTTETGSNPKPVAIDSIQTKDGANAKDLLLLFFVIGEEQALSTQRLNALANAISAFNDAQKATTDIAIAFGGSDDVPGLAIADADQLIADATDGELGNEPNSHYSYRSTVANLGEVASLQRFTEYAAARFSNYRSTTAILSGSGSAFGPLGGDTNYNGDSLNRAELRSALSAIAATETLSTIVFDTQFGGSAENAALTATFTDTHIGSTSLHNGVDLAQLAQTFARHSATSFATNLQTNSDIPLTIYNQSAFDEFSRALNQLYSFLSLDNDEQRLALLQSLGDSLGHSFREQGSASTDLRQLVEQLATRLSNSSNINLAISEIRQAMADYIVASNKPGSADTTLAAPTLNPEAYSPASFTTHVRFIGEQVNELAINDSSPPSFANSREIVAVDSDGNATDATPGVGATAADENLLSVEAIYGYKPNISANSEFVPLIRKPANRSGNEYIAAPWDNSHFVIRHGGNALALSVHERNRISNDDNGTTTVIFSSEVEVDGAAAELRIETEQSASGSYTVNNAYWRRYKSIAANENAEIIEFAQPTSQLEAGSRISTFAEHLVSNTMPQQRAFKLISTEELSGSINIAYEPLTNQTASTALLASDIANNFALTDAGTDE